MKVRQVRVLIYEGPEEWVTATLERSYVRGQRIIALDMKNGVIEKSITEHVSPAVMILEPKNA